MQRYSSQRRGRSKPGCWRDINCNTGGAADAIRSAQHIADVLRVHLLQRGFLARNPRCLSVSGEHALQGKEEQGSKKTTGRQGHHPGHYNAANDPQIDGADAARQTDTDDRTHRNVRG